MLVGSLHARLNKNIAFNEHDTLLSAYIYRYHILYEHLTSTFDTWPQVACCKFRHKDPRVRDSSSSQFKVRGIELKSY